MKLSRTIALTALAAIIGTGAALAADTGKPAQSTAPATPAATQGKSAATETPAQPQKHPKKKHHAKSKAKKEQPTG